MFHIISLVFELVSFICDRKIRWLHHIHLCLTIKYE